MKLLIAGSGMIVKDFLPIAKDIDGLQLEAIFGKERSLAAMQSLADTYGIKEIYHDFSQALEKTEADTVYIALPNALHYQFAKQALAAGKHVICEKPFTLKSSELKELIALAKEKNLVLLEAITNQYLTNYQLVKDSLPKLGDIKLVSANYSQYSSRYDAFRAGEILPAFNPKMGGGALMDINIYNLHFVVGVFGRPKTVHYEANIENGIDTSGILTLGYEQFKVVCIGAKDSGPFAETVIQGNDGMLVVKGPNNTVDSLEIQQSGKVEVLDEKVHSHRMFEEFQNFVSIIAKNDQDFVAKQSEHSLIVMEIAEKALDSVGIKLG